MIRRASARPSGRRSRRCRRGTSRSWTKAGGIMARGGPSDAARAALSDLAHFHRREATGEAPKAPPAPIQTAKSVSFVPLASAAFSQRGCRPRPLQDSPVEALRYLAATLLPLDLVFFALLPLDRFRGRPRSGHIRPSGRAPSRSRRRAPASWFARSAARALPSAPSIPAVSPRRILCSSFLSRIPAARL